MKQHPILFSTPMVKAIMEGRKTQTRRVIKRQPDEEVKEVGIGNFSTAFTDRNGNLQEGPEAFGAMGDDCEYLIIFPYGNIGDVLWVKETFYAYGWWVKEGKTKAGKPKWSFKDFTVEDKNGKYHYIDCPPAEIVANRKERIMGWYKRPSIFMPERACRIYLRIIDLRSERLTDINEDDAIAEGVSNVGEQHQDAWFNYEGGTPFISAGSSFFTLWSSINGGESVIANPWVWAISFKRIENPNK